jgi:hypothetical protein
MPDLSLLVLAAGIGRRYRGLKQVEAVGPSGEAILDYAVYDALRAGFSRVAFVIRREIEEPFRRTIGRYWEKRVAVSYVYQELESGLPKGFVPPAGRQKPWGTAHAALLSRETIDDTPFALINADDFYGPSAYRDLGACLKGNAQKPGGPDEYCFVGYRLKNTLSEFGSVARGVCALDENGYLGEVVERVRIEREGEAARFWSESDGWIPLSGEEIVSLNFWGFAPTLFAHLERGFTEFLGRTGRSPDSEYFVPFAVNELIKSGKARVKYIPTSEKWFGVTYPEDVPRARARIRELVKAGVYPENLKQ